MTTVDESTTKKKKSTWKGLAKKALLGGSGESRPLTSSHHFLRSSRSNALSEVIVSNLKADKYCDEGISHVNLPFPMHEIEAELIQIWVEKALPNWSDKFSAKESIIKPLVIVGVPQEIRAEYWKLAIANSLKLTPEYYRIILVKLSTIRQRLLEISQRYQSGIASAYSVAAAESSSDSQPTTGWSKTVLSAPRSMTISTTAEVETRSSPKVEHLARRRTYDHAAETSTGLLYATPELSDIVAERAYTHHNLSDLVAPARYEVELVRKSFEGIAVDLHRTIPRQKYPQSTSPLTQTNESLVDSLRSILETFCLYRPDIGYVQGMACLAANFLLVMDEYSAFVCFSNLVMRDTILAFYRFDLPVIRLYCAAFDVLLKRACPHFWAKLSQSSFRSDIFLIEWWFTLFTRALPNDVLWSVWDFYLLDGDLVLFQTALALVKSCSATLNSVSIEAGMLLLTSHPTSTSKVSSAQFFHTVKSLKLTTKKLKKAFAAAKIVLSLDRESKRGDRLSQRQLEEEEDDRLSNDTSSVADDMSSPRAISFETF